MISNLLLFLLAAGLPYYIFFEKSKKFNSKAIFLLSGFLLLCAIVLSIYVENEHKTFLVIISLASAVFTIYKATKTTNFYKLGYYFIFINAPFFLLFEEKGALYSLSMLLSLVGIYFIARFYEKNYGSANFLSVRGITLTTPCVGSYLTLYLIAIALYPPFPNSIFFFSYIFSAEVNILWYTVIITLFFGNFILAMNVMKKTLFGRANPNIHYVHMSLSEKLFHFGIIILLLLLSLYGLKEIL